MIFKRMSDIYSRLVDLTITNTSQVNDFSVGSAMRAIYEAFSIELEQFYILTRENILEAIEDGVYNSFGFQRKQATTAYGYITLTFNSPTQTVITIPRGSKFMSSQTSFPQIYATLRDYVVPTGSVTAKIQVYCTITGSYGNVSAGIVDQTQSPLMNIKSVTNQEAFQTGQDMEPINQMRARFQSYIKSLSKATVPALDYGTRSIPEVAGCFVNETTGLITIYAHDMNGDLPSNVVAEITSMLPDYKPAGIPVQVQAVTKTLTDVTVYIYLANQAYNTSAFASQIESVILNYLNSMQVSKSLILSDLTTTIKSIDRINIYDVQFTLPVGNAIVSGNEIVRAGQITVYLR